MPNVIMGERRVSNSQAGFVAGVVHYAGILLGVCLLLLFNGLAVQVALMAYLEYAPQELDSPKAQQGLRFVLPLFMLVLEYWLWDWFRDQWSSSEQDRA